jgi:hypothetical protein
MAMCNTELQSEQTVEAIGLGTKRIAGLGNSEGSTCDWKSLNEI